MIPVLVILSVLVTPPHSMEPESNPIGSSSLIPALQDTIRLDMNCEYDLTGDGNPETFQVTAAGLEWKKLRLRLVVTSSRGDSLFTDDWTSQWYFAIPVAFNPNTPEGGERLIRKHLEDMTDLSSFRVGFYGGRMPQRLRELIRGELGATATDERVEALGAELDRATFYYYVKGMEDIGVLVWSSRENRLLALENNY